jgi:ferredoxin
MHVQIDTAKCTGHGMCYVTAADVFGDDDDGYGVVLHDGIVESSLEEQARRGAANCPERAISISD